MADIVTDRTKEKYYWIQYIKRRIEQNKNFLATLTGQTGSGKSWSALSICEMIDPSFNIDRVIFKGRDLMKMINSDELPKRKGVTFLWDEVGVDLSSRNWQSLANKMLNFLIQTFRHRCFILLFTTPYEDFVDSGTRKLFHAELRTQSINFQNKTTKLKPKLLQYNPELKKFYKKYLRVITSDGVVPLIEWNIPKPSEELIEQYEIKKTRFTTELNRNIERQLVAHENKDLKPLTELQEKILGCWNKGLTNQKKIGELLGKKQPQIAVNERYMRQKGYNRPNNESITPNSVIPSKIT